MPESILRVSLVTTESSAFYLLPRRVKVLMLKKMKKGLINPLSAIIRGRTRCWRSHYP